MSSVTVLQTMRVRVQLDHTAPFFSETHTLFLPLQNLVQCFSVKIVKIPSDFTHCSSAFLPERENILSGTITFFSIDVLQLSLCCRLVFQSIPGDATEMAWQSSLFVSPLSCIFQHCSGFIAVKEQTACSASWTHCQLT